ncbi:hypothetical protein JTB14_022398 [Gonioctena quinquepunctata]|nr:hypothetical protein JTB14_022398 [Gonioctena quinquepunctata]
MEETILLNLVKDHAKILKNKKTDSGANHKKAQCWVDIEKAFNCQSWGSYRNITVKKKYENIKKKTKKKMADEKCHKLGPNLKTEISSIDNTILEILGSVRVEGFPSEFGGDAVTVPEENVEPLQDDSEFLYDCEENNNTVHEDQCQKSEDIFVEVYSDEARKENITEETNEVQWAKYTPDMLKRKEAKALTQARTNNENQISTKISQCASVKAALEEEKEELLDE